MSDHADLRESLNHAKRKHIAVLNRLESHLGCVVCHGPLTDGRCPDCQPAPLSADPGDST